MADAQHHEEGWRVTYSCPPVVGSFEPFVGCGNHFVAHVTIGLEHFAADEAARALDASPIVVLQGKIAFRTNAPYSMVRMLRSIESIALLCWVSPTPRMPTSAEAFGTAFQALMAETVCPQLASLGRAWRAASSFSDSRATIAFRVTARRSGSQSSCVVRQDLARWLAEAWHDAADGAFTATARNYDLEICIQWSDLQVCIELPCEGRLSARAYTALPTLHAPLGWMLARLANLAPGATVVDPMVGRGGLLVEAAFVQPRAVFVGCDRSADQLIGAVTNVAAARRHDPTASPISLLLADVTALPFADGSVDAILCDLPFGRQHGKRKGLYEDVLQQCRRVLRPGGVAVLLTTCLRELQAAVQADSDGWLMAARHHLMIGPMKAGAHVLRRVANNAPAEPIPPVGPIAPIAPCALPTHTHTHAAPVAPTAPAVPEAASPLSRHALSQPWREVGSPRHESVLEGDTLCVSEAFASRLDLSVS